MHRSLIGRVPYTYEQEVMDLNPTVGSELCYSRQGAFASTVFKHPTYIY